MNITNRITFWVLVATVIVLIPTAFCSYWRTMLLLGRHLPEGLVQSTALHIGASQVVISSTSMAFLILAFRLVAKNIARPICQLQEAALAIASGNLEVLIPDTGRHDEIEALADSFRKMQRELKSNIVSLAETIKSKEKMESDLRVAHDIQMSLVPDRMPETPLKNRFDLSASMKTAKQVGGDFYDYFMTDDETLCLVIADVSGKGVPAALLMARCSALFRNLLLTSRDLGYTLSQVNNVACGENNACMFITLFAVFIHLPTGHCRYVNAGHNPPYLKHRDLWPEMMPFADNLPLGIDETNVFHERTFEMHEDDLLFLYTDGATEALNAQHELFGEKRTEATLDRSNGRPCRETINDMIDAIRHFVLDVSQSDDTTMLALRWRPS